MSKTNNNDDVMTPDALKKVIKALIQEVLKKQPELLEPKKIDELVNQILKAITQNGQKLQRKDIMEPAFKNKLALCVMTALVLQNNQHLQEALKLIFDSKKANIAALLKLDPKALKEKMAKEFTPEELKQLKDKLKLAMQDLFADLKTRFKLEPKPGAVEQSTEYAYQNIFGLICGTTGGLAIPVSVFLGNGLGFNDWNPNNGMAPIDNLKPTNTNSGGDPLGMKAHILENLIGMETNSATRMVDDAIYNAGEKPGIANRPAYTRS